MELLYGRRAVLEALRAGRRRMHRVYLGGGVRQSGIVLELLDAAEKRQCPVLEASRERLAGLGDISHQGVLADAGPYAYADPDEVLADGDRAKAGGAKTGADVFLVLDHLQDVQNVGTLLRTAEAMAVRAVLLPDRRSASITPAVVNASAGAVEHLDVALVGNLVQSLERLKAAGVWIVGLETGPGAVPLGQADLVAPVALVVGSEGGGLARLTREHCDWILSIPMYGKVASLNAAVAGSIALVAARQAAIKGAA